MNALSTSAIAGKASVLVASGATMAIPVTQPTSAPASAAAAAGEGLLRGQLAVPISTTNPPDDTVLFEQPADANQKLYIPRYWMGQQTVSGTQQYRMSFKKVETTWILAIHLEKFPADEIPPEKLRGAQELAHVPSVELVFQVPVIREDGTQFLQTISRPFQEIVAESDGMSVTLTMNSLNEMNQVFTALTDAQSGTRLIVRRATHVAIQSTRPGDQVEKDQLLNKKKSIQDHIASLLAQVRQLCGQPDVQDAQAAISLLQGRNNQYQTAINQAQANLLRLQQAVREATQELQDYLSLTSDIQTFPGRPNRPTNPAIVQKLRQALAAARVPLAAANTSIQRNQEAIQANNQNIAQIMSISSDIAADWNKINQIDQRLDEIANPRFAIADFALNMVIEPEPFIFPKDTNEYIYGVVTGDGDSLGLVPYQVKWQNTFYRYYQNLAQPEIIYYLPDSFKQARTLKQARQGDATHKPDMRVQFNITGNATDGVQALLNYHAVPWVDHNRLASAAGELSTHIGNGGKGVRFEPLAVGSDKVDFRLATPPSGDLQDMTAKAQVDFQNGISGTLTMGLDDFQNAFSAMLGGSITLLSGQIHIDLGGGETDDVPLAIRMDDLAGEVFDYQVISDAASGGAKVTLCNAIESPLQVNQLSTTLVRGTAQVAATIQEFQPALPCTLQPGDNLTCIVVPNSPLNGDESLSVVFDVSGVKIMPDRDKVWEAILDPTTSAEYLQEIQVQTFPQTYNALPDHPEQANALYIQFEYGDSVVEDDGSSKPGNTIQLDPAHLSAAIHVGMPISDYVLNRPDQGQYRYKLTVIRNTEQATDPQWRTDSRTILPVSSLADVPNH
jgi:hypothetical protein